MPWQVAALLKIAGGSVLAPLAFRLLGEASAPERAKRIALQYGWALALVLPLAFVWGESCCSSEAWKIAVLGALTTLGVFFQWRAYALSLSRSAIFIPLSSVIPLMLSAALLGEWLSFSTNLSLLLGFFLAVLGLALHVSRDVRQKRNAESGEPLPRAFYANAIAFTLIFGIATFLLNHWAKAGVPAAEFLIFWYAGAFAGSIVLLFFMRTFAPPEQAPMPSTATHALIALAGLSIVLNMAMEYVALQRAPQTVVLPIFAVADIVGPVLVGCLVFREWAKLYGLEWLYLGVALTGALIMAVAHT
jgi:hypothetical protein